jgi:broad specificity phosphatase PhoE
MVTIVHLVRHGQVHNPQQILYGRLPGFQLSAAGEQEAEQASDYLRTKPVFAIYASPAERTQATANRIAAHFRQPVLTDPLLHEVAVPYDGTPLEKLERIGFQLYAGNRTPFETEADVLARTQVFLRRMLADHADQQVVAVTHGDVIVFAFLHACGAAPRVQKRGDLSHVYGLPDPYPVTGSVSSLELPPTYPDDPPAFRYWRPGIS